MHQLPHQFSNNPLRTTLWLYAAITAFLTVLAASKAAHVSRFEYYDETFWYFLLPIASYGAAATVSLASAALSLRCKWGIAAALAGLTVAVPGAAFLMTAGCCIFVIAPKGWTALLAFTGSVPAALNAVGCYLLFCRTPHYR